MSASLKLGRIAGVDLRVHASFVFLIIWVALEHYRGGLSPLEPLVAVLFTLAVFATIVLHELGHALVARSFGIRTLDVLLLPIGGLARLERAPETPASRVAIALAGPATNLAVAAAIFLALELDERSLGHSLALGPLGPFLAKLMWVNVGLAAFNVLPAFPLDGGCALRAALAAELGEARATIAAARAGKAVAVGLAIAGVVEPFLIIIALFLWIGAEREMARARLGLERASSFGL